jgi:hypothetical protein
LKQVSARRKHTSDNTEWPVFHVLLDRLVAETAPDESLGVVHGVHSVGTGLPFRLIPSQVTHFGIDEGHVRRGGAVAQIVSENFHLIMREKKKNFHSVLFKVP